MRKTILKAIIGLAVIASMALSVQANTISGNITFTGGVTLDGPDAQFIHATHVDSWVSPINSSNPHPLVSGVDGDFATTISQGDEVDFTHPWYFADTGDMDLWQVGGFTFRLTSWTITKHDGSGIVVDGLGEITGNSFTQTTGAWNFSTQPNAANGIFSFSASGAAVPDGGLTAMLLGMGMMSLGWVRRQVKR